MWSQHTHTHTFIHSCNKSGSANVFTGKKSLITLRDLFRWADRRPAGYEELARDGYMLLAERVRTPEEKQRVKETIEKYLLNGKELDLEQLHTCDESLVSTRHSS